MLLETWKSKGNYFTIEGHEVFYQDAGKGETLVLLHGFVTSSWDWQKVYAPLTKLYRVIIPDFIGFGFSDKPQKYAYTTESRALSIAALLNKLDIHQAHIAACSFSVSVVQELLCQQKQEALSFDVKSVCLLNGGLLTESNNPSIPQRLMLSPFGSIITHFFSKKTLDKTLRSIFAKETQPDKQLIDDYWDMLQYNEGIRILHKAVHYLKERQIYVDRWRLILQNTDVPIRLIWGVDQHDTISGKETVEQYKSLVNNPDVIELPSIGHYPQLEAPKLFIRHLDEFIKYTSSYEKSI